MAQYIDVNSNIYKDIEKTSTNFLANGLATDDLSSEQTGGIR